jgi:hypothetical protein
MRGKQLTIVLGATALVAGAVIGCSQAGGTPVIAGDKPTVVVQADCGQDGVANVRINFGQVDDKFLIGRNAVTKNIGGGSDNLDRRYSLAAGYDTVPLTVTTDPTTGTCKTTLTNDDTGDVVAQKETAGKAELTVNLKNKS